MVYVDKNITSAGSLGLGFFNGSYAQGPWGYLSSFHPTEALSYRGIAYVASGGYSLGNNAQLPNHNMEVMGVFSYTGAQVVISEQHTIPSSGPGIITVSFASTFIADYGVTDSNGNAYTQVYPGEALLPYEYQLLSPGVYGFSDVPNDVDVTISYLSSDSPDADPSLVIADILTNPHYGAGFPSGRLGSLAIYQAYCIASGLLISPAYTTQTQTSSMLDDLSTATNSAFVWSSGALTLVPYGDAAISGNGYSYTPPSSPLYNLTPDDFMPNTNATASSSSSANNDPVLLTRKRASDNLNSIKIECLDRGNSYNSAIIEAQDQALIQMFGLRQSNSMQMHMFADLKRRAYVRTTAITAPGDMQYLPVHARPAVCAARPDGYRYLD